MNQRRPCALEDKPHDRARCDIHTGSWVVDTVDGQVRSYHRQPQQMARCQIDASWPPLVGTLGDKVCDVTTGFSYNQGVEALPLINGGFAPSIPESEEALRKSWDGRRPGRGGLTTSAPFDYKLSHLSNGIAMDRAYTGYRGKGTPFVTAQGLLSPSQTGMSQQIHRARGYQQKNSSVLPLLRQPAYPDPSAYKRTFGTSRISRDNNLKTTSSLTPEDVIAATQLYLRPGDANDENNAIIHRGKRN